MRVRLKRSLAMMLCVIMVLGLFPTAVLAAGECTCEDNPGTVTLDFNDQAFDVYGGLYRYTMKAKYTPNGCTAESHGEYENFTYSVVQVYNTTVGRDVTGEQSAYVKIDGDQIEFYANDNYDAYTVVVKASCGPEGHTIESGTSRTFTLTPRKSNIADWDRFIMDIGEGTITVTTGTEEGSHVYTQGFRSLTAPAGQAVTISGTSVSSDINVETNRIVIQKGTPEIILEDLTITMNANSSSPDHQASPIQLWGTNVPDTVAVAPTIRLVGTNNLTGGSWGPGIRVCKNAILTIEGSGSLVASGRNNMPGIGAGANGAVPAWTSATDYRNHATYNGDGQIVINGGTITSIGSGRGTSGLAAGMGQSYYYSTASVTINGGDINIRNPNNGCGLVATDIAINGGTLNISVGNTNNYGMHATNLTVTGGTMLSISGKTKIYAENADITGGNIQGYYTSPIEGRRRVQICFLDTRNTDLSAGELVTIQEGDHTWTAYATNGNIYTYLDDSTTSLTVTYGAFGSQTTKEISFAANDEIILIIGQRTCTCTVDTSTLILGTVANQTLTNRESGSVAFAPATVGPSQTCQAPAHPNMIKSAEIVYSIAVSDVVDSAGEPIENYPEDLATLSGRTITYKALEENGGKYTVTITAQSGEKTATTSFTVKTVKSSIFSLSRGALTVTQGDNGTIYTQGSTSYTAVGDESVTLNGDTGNSNYYVVLESGQANFELTSTQSTRFSDQGGSANVHIVSNSGFLLISDGAVNRITASHSYYYPSYAVLNLGYADITFNADGSITQGNVTVSGYEWNDDCYLIGAADAARTVTNNTGEALTLTINGKQVTIENSKSYTVPAQLSTAFVGYDDRGDNKYQPNYERAKAWVIPGAASDGGNLLVVAGSMNAPTEIYATELVGIEGVTELYVDPRIATLQCQLLNNNTKLTDITVNTPTVNAAFFGLSESANRDITLGSNVRTLLQPWLLRHAESLTVAPDSSYYKVQEDVLFNQDGSQLLAALTSKTGEYTVPQGVTTIGQSAFADSELTTITLSSTVSSIESNAFLNCASLTGVYVDEDNPYFTSVDGVLYSKDMTRLIFYPLSKTDEEYVVPEGVSYVTAGAVSGNTHLKSLTLPGNAITIEAGGFSNLENLETLTFKHANVSGDGAFAGCTGITALNLPHGYNNWARKLFDAATVGGSEAEAASMNWLSSDNVQICQPFYPYTGGTPQYLVGTDIPDVNVRYKTAEGDYTSTKPECVAAGKYTLDYCLEYTDAGETRKAYSSCSFEILSSRAQPTWFTFTPSRIVGDAYLLLGADVRLQNSSNLLTVDDFTVYYSKNGTGKTTSRVPTEPGNYLVSIQILPGRNFYEDNLELGWYVVLEQDQVVINFVSNGGSDVPSLVGNAGDTISSWPANPVRDGFAFTTWRDADNMELSGPLKQFPVDDTTYYADWLRLDYTITYDLGGGTVAGDGNRELYTPETPTFALSNPTKDNHTFLGWTWVRTDPNDDGAVLETQTEPQTDVFIEAGTYGNYAFKANWQQDTYAVTFYANNSGYEDAAFPGSGAKELKRTMPRETTLTLDSIPVPVRTGYDFVGWVTSPDGTGEVLTENIYADRDQTYYAQWTPKTVTVTFIGNGGSFTVGEGETSTRTTLTGKYGENLEAPIPSRTGYTFTGWDTVVNTFPAEDVTLTAQWTPNDCTLTFVVTNPANPDQSETRELTGAYDAKIINDNLTGGAIPEPNYTADGFLFMGWTDASGNIITDMETQYIRGDATYTAYFTATAGWQVTFHAAPKDSTDSDAAFAGNVKEKTYYVSAAAPFSVDDVPLPVWAENTFTGWVDGNGDTVSGDLTYQTLGGDQHYYATYKQTTYTVTFNYNGGKVDGSSDTFKTIEGKKKDEVVLVEEVPALTLEGKNFLGWLNLNDNKTYATAADVAEVAITKNTSYIALWETLTYNVTYLNYNQGTGQLVVPTVYDQAPAAPAVTPAGGYLFIHWKVTQPAEGVLVDGVRKTELTADDLTKLKVTEDITLTAQFAQTNYTVSFEANGGEFTGGDAPTYSVAYNETLSSAEGFTAPDVTREGSNFLGWMRTGDPTLYVNDTYDPDYIGNALITNTTVFIAVWSGDVRVTFNANGGTITSGSDFLNGQSDDPMSGLPIASRTGYTFTQWYTDRECTNPAGSAGSYTFPLESTTWYAGWEAKPVTIRFDYDKGIFNGQTERTLTRAYGGPVVDKEGDLPAPTKTGYRLVGWTNDAGLMVPVAEMPKQLVTNENGMTFTAYYEENMITLTFEAGEGAQFPDSSAFMEFTRAEGEEMNLSSVPVPVKPNFDFKGWKLTGAEDGTAQETGEVTFTEDQTYVAVWAPSQYTITFNLNGGTVGNDGSTVTGTYNHGADYPEAPVPEKEGNSLLGWMNSDTGEMYGTADGQNPFPETVTANATYVAVWGSKTYTLTFTNFDYSEGGLGEDSSRQVSVVNGGIAAGPTVIPPAGQVFQHWKVTESDSAGTTVGKTFTAEELLEIQVKGDITFEAVFAPANVTVTFQANNGAFEGGVTSQELSGNAGSKIEPVPTPTRLGYTFNGWFKDSDCHESAMTDGTYKFPNANATWYAGWTDNKLTAEQQGTLTYTGSGLDAAFTVLQDKKPIADLSLKETTYALAPGDSNAKLDENGKPLNAGTYTATMTVYSDSTLLGTVTVNVTVGKAAISAATLKATSLTYDGQEKTPAVTSITANSVTHNAPALGTDYTVTYANNINAGKATATVTGQGNFMGSVPVDFTIEPNTGALNVEPTNALTYTGSGQDARFTVTDGSGNTLPAGSYTVSYAVKNSGSLKDKKPCGAGSYTATITGTGNWDGATGTVDITVAKYGSTAPGEVLIATNGVSYSTSSTEADFTRNLVVKDIYGNTLAKDTDYTISYDGSSNFPTSVGVYTATFTGTGDNYDGANAKATLSFVVTDTNLEVTLSESSKTYTGAEFTNSELEKLVSTVGGAAVDWDKYTLSVAGGSTVQDVGSYALIVTAKDGTGSGVAPFTVTARALQDTEVTLAEDTYTYDGKAKIPAVTVTVEGSALDTSNYTVAYANNTNAGTATVTVTGIGNYAGTVEKKFSIGEKSIGDGSSTPAEGLTVGSISDQTYTGSPLTPDVSIQYGTLTLVKGTDYTLGYTDNTNKGTATVTVTGMGNYEGSFTTTFNIVAPNQLSASVGNTNWTYDGNANAGKLTVTFGGAELTVGANGYSLSIQKDGTDFAGGVEAIKNAGTYAITVTGTGSYVSAGSYTVTVTVSKAPVTITPNTDQKKTYGQNDPELTYTTNGIVVGEEATVSVTGSLNRAAGEGAGSYDYDISSLSITSDNYTLKLADDPGQFTIKPKSLDNSMVTGIDDSYVYTGKQIKPVPTVTDSGNALPDTNGKLTENVDYTLGYGANLSVGVGSGTVTITGKGNYTGTVEKQFEIRASDGNLSPTLNPNQNTYNYAVQKPVVSVMLDGIVLTEQTDGSEQDGYYVDWGTGDYTAAGIYTVTVHGTGAYKDLAPQTAAYTIAPYTGNLTVTMGTNSFAYGATAGDAVARIQKVIGVGSEELTSGAYTITIDDASYEAGNVLSAGQHTITVTATDSNYKTADGSTAATGTVQINVGLRSIENADVTVEDNTKEYNGKDQTATVTVTLDGTPLIENRDFFVEYGGQTTGQTNKGEYAITVKGTGNYEGEVTPTKTLKIDPKPLSNDMIQTIPDQPYTGAEVKPAVNVVDSEIGTALVEGLHYTVKYSSNTEIGQATVTITAVESSNYSDEATANFTIRSRVAALTVEVDPATAVFGSITEDPEIKVMDGETELKLNTDYTLSYKRYADDGTLVEAKNLYSAAGVYLIQVEGIGSYDGSQNSATFVLTPKSEGDGQLVIKQSNRECVYDGINHLPTRIEVKWNDTDELTEGVDYTLSYSYNGAADQPLTADTQFINAGVYVVTAKAQGNYAGTASFVVTITPKNISDADVTVTIPETTYNAQEQQANITVKDLDNTLTLVTDYTVDQDTYTNANEAGHEIVITGTGNYFGTRTEHFVIHQATITVTTDPVSITYGDVLPDIDTIIPTIEGICTEDEAYVNVTLSWPTDRNAGPHTLVVTLSGDKSDNYKVDASGATLTVTAKDMNGENSGVTAVLEPNYSYYNGAAVTPNVVVKDGETLLANGTDYTVTYKNSKGETVTTLVEVGSYTVTVTGTGNYIGTFDLVYSINSRPSGGGGGTIRYTIEAKAGRGGKITPDGETEVRDGGRQTFQIIPDEGYTISLVLVDGKNVGAVSSYTFEKVSDNHTIEAMFAQTDSKLTFVDVPAGSYYYDAVYWAVEHDITNGTGGNKFSPDAVITRAQMVTFLWRAYGAPKVTCDNPFTDVDADAYYYDAVLWAVSNGVTKGTSATTFSPDLAVTRSQAVTFQWRASGAMMASGDSFSDVPEDVWYTDAVTWAAVNGITKGTSATTFSPDMVVSRAQVVTFLYRELGMKE